MFSKNQPDPPATTRIVSAVAPTMHAVLARIFSHLSTNRDGAAIDPLDIAPDLLPHLFILAIERGDHGEVPQLRVRLTGSALDSAFGRCVKGSCLEEFLHGPHSGDVLESFRACIRPGEARWMRQIVKITGRAPRFVEGVAVHVDPDRIYGGLIFGEIARCGATAGFESRCL